MTDFGIPIPSLEPQRLGRQRPYVKIAAANGSQLEA